MRKPNCPGCQGPTYTIYARIKDNTSWKSVKEHFWCPKCQKMFKFGGFIEIKEESEIIYFDKPIKLEKGKGYRFCIKDGTAIVVEE